MGSAVRTGGLTVPRKNGPRERTLLGGEDGFDEKLRVERIDVGQSFAQPYELDRNVEHVSNTDHDAAPGATARQPGKDALT